MLPILRTNVSAMAPQAAAAGLEDAPEVPAKPPIQALARLAKLILIFGVGGGFLWMVTAPLSSAVHTPGVVAVESFRKTVRSMDGGIVTEVLVRDGQRVSEGQPLLKLEDVEAQSSNDTLHSLYWSAQARLARLRAEADGKDGIDFPATLLERSEAAAKVAVENERALFLARRTAYGDELATLHRQIDELRVAIRSADDGKVQVQRQLALLRDELDGVRQLYDKGLAPKTRLLALERGGADLEGRVVELVGRSESSRRRIAVVEAQLREKESLWRQEIATNLKAVSAELAEYAAKLPSTQQAVQRRVIASPQDGVVVGMTVHGAGAVVRPGEAILEIVPDQDEMIVQVQITPGDIDTVYVGLPAEVVFPAFRFEDVPRLMGELIYVSADRMLDANGQAYFEGRVRLSRRDIERIPRNLRLLPGMNAEVLLILGERTFARYIIQPFMKGLDKALIER